MREGRNLSGCCVRSFLSRSLPYFYWAMHVELEKCSAGFEELMEAYPKAEGFAGGYLRLGFQRGSPNRIGG